MLVNIRNTTHMSKNDRHSILASVKSADTQMSQAVLQKSSHVSNNNAMTVVYFEGDSQRLAKIRDMHG